MASGLQCPGCGHVHPSGLPEIARGDATFRCYGCYRMLSVPEGWTGRPSARLPAPGLSPTEDAPPGAGTRDARSARLAGRRGSRAAALTRESAVAPGGDLPTHMVPPATPDGPTAGDPGTAAWSVGDVEGWAGGAAAAGGRAGSAAGLSDSARAPDPAGRSASGAAAGRSGGGADAGPLGWVASRRSDTPVPKPTRVLVWAAAFGLGLVITAFVLRKVGLLSVNTAIDLYAGSGARRFGILLVLLPVWALLSATIAHFSLEGLAKRRRPRSASRRSPAKTSAG